jgi:hypothetical protein
MTLRTAAVALGILCGTAAVLGAAFVEFREKNCPPPLIDCTKLAPNIDVVQSACIGSGPEPVRGWWCPPVPVSR